MWGGDPLLLSDRRIDEICKRLRAIPHLEVLRIGSRIPCHLPERVTPELCAILKRYHPLYINTHFNHPDELTPAAVTALGMLADAGIPLGCQTVLLKGVNDDPEVMKRSEEHTSELQSQSNLVCRLLLEKKNTYRRARRADQSCTTLYIR